MSSFVLVSAYTTGTPYEQEMDRLVKSLDQIGPSLERDIVGYAPLGSWEKNCQKKALLIKETLLKNKKPILWVDADAEVFKYPVFFEDLDCDLSCFYFFPAWAKEGELLSGTLYFNYSAKSLDLIDRWIQLNESNMAWDQKNLQTAVEHMFGALKIMKFPVEYIKIENFDKYMGDTPPIIYHHQASRRFKQAMSGVRNG